LKIRDIPPVFIYDGQGSADPFLAIAALRSARGTEESGETT